jgi:hypothetical protein
VAITTNVPAPSFGPTGFVAPAESDILAGRLADINAAFGGNLNLDLVTPQGQLASSDTAIIGNCYDTFVAITNQVDPAFADGRMQDGIARIYFIERNPALPTSLQVSCLGLSGVAIPVGAQISDPGGNIYICTQAGVIPPGGSVTLSFACSTVGAVAVPATVSIFQAIPGWDSATVVSGVEGQETESRADFEARRAASVAQNSRGSLPSIVGAVLNVPNVIDAFVTENPTSSPLTIGGFTLVPNSVYVAAVGGDPVAIAQAIWSRKAPGCNYNGNTTVTVLDTNSGYTPPFPAYAVQFEIPPALPILFSVSIANSVTVPSNATALIQAAIISAFAGQDGGPRARIGSTIFASRYYAPIAALGSWAQIVSISVGTVGATLNAVAVGIAQVPTISASNIAVSLV